MANKAWVTLVTNDTYALGALVLAHSLKKVNTAHKLVVLVSSNVTFAMRGTLQSIYDEVKEVNILDSADTENLRLLARPELGITFTKLHCWKLTQYEKCVFLDADTLVLQNCDELFDREELSAAPDVGWPDCFNSGVFVFKPSEETFKSLYEFAITHGSFDGGDQGLLNMYFSDWATSDASKRLPFLYNLSSAAIYSYLPAFKWYGRGVKIVHFIGTAKPWVQPFNSLTRSVEAAPGSSHLQNFLQYWWDLFCACVHPQLSPEMTRLLLRSWYTPHITIKNNPSRNTRNPTRNEVYIPEPFVAPEIEEHFIFTDPWEEFEKNIASSVVLEPSNNNHCVTGCSYNNDNVPNCNNENQRCNFNSSYDDEDQRPNDYHHVVVNKYGCFEPSACEPKYIERAPAPVYCQNSVEVYYTASIVPTQSERLTFCDNRNSSSYIDNQCNLINNHVAEQINVYDEIHRIDDKIDCDSVHNNEHSCDIPVNNYSSIHSLTNEILREENNYSESNRPKENDVDAGLANSLSQMKLDEATPEQKAREDFLRRQNWEHGNIDYMGKDSFNNIWDKISQTMNFQPEADPSAIDKASSAESISSPSSTESSAPVQSSVPETCPKAPSSAQPSQQAPASAQSVEEPQSCPKPPASAQPAVQPASCPKPPASAQTTEQPASCPKPPAASQPAEQPASCPKPPAPSQPTEQPASCPKPPAPSQPTEQLASCPKPPAPSRPTEQPASCPKPPAPSQPPQQPATAEPTEAPLCCPKPSKPAPTEPTVSAPVAEVPVAPTPSKPAVESTPAPVAAATQPTPQVPTPVEKSASSAPEASPVCQKPAPIQAQGSQEAKPAPAQDPKSKPAAPAPAKSSGSKKK
ncbi:uncharacterized protein Gyg isoform X2 [Planococcus citri]|uniref:uncharacterized protein Gyg isoform X2 n=1 Tax=Planococcus citri TaxID=170843 RepID=UPI0031F883DB